MSGLTKEQLEQRVQELEAQNLGLREAQEGWLVTVPNPLFDEQVYGLQFINGQTFIRKNQIVDAFVVAPTKDTYFVKMGYNDKQIKGIRDREAISSAERAAKTLEADFHYNIKYFSLDDVDRLEDNMNTRALERTQLERSLSEKNMADQIVSPEFLGG